MKKTKKFKAKKRGYRLGARTFTGKAGHEYMVFRAPDGSYHVFVEIEAKRAAKDCGAKTGTTRQVWDSLWRSN